MRSIIFATLVSVLLPAAAFAQSDEDLRNAGKNPRNSHLRMSYSQQRFSALNQINRQTIKRLVPAWSYSMASKPMAKESQVLVKDAVMYVTSHDKTVAVDVLTARKSGKLSLNIRQKRPGSSGCGIVNRGAAIYRGMRSAPPRWRAWLRLI